MEINTHYDTNPTLSAVTKIVGFLTLFVSIFMVFIIAYKSSPAMYAYRPYLLTLQVSSGCFDIFLSLLLSPITIPMLGGYCTGYFTQFTNMSGYTQLELTFACGELFLLSMIACFLYRHQLAQFGNSRFKLPPIAYFGSAGSLMHLSRLDDAEENIAITKKFNATFPEEILRLKARFVYNILNPWLFIWQGWIACLLSGGLLLILSLIGHTLYSLNSIMSIGISQETKQKQKHLLNTLSLQACIPILLSYAPIIILMCTMSGGKLQFDNKELAQLCVSIASTHSIANSVLLVARTKCYRQYVLCRRKDSTPEAVTVNVLSMNNIPPNNNTNN